MTTVTVTIKGQIVIPSHIRRKLNITRGTRLAIEERGGEIVLKAITPAYFKKIAGTLDTKGKLSRALVDERKHDAGREG